jgi:hypothetical protein
MKFGGSRRKDGVIARQNSPETTYLGRIPDLVPGGFAWQRLWRTLPVDHGSGLMTVALNGAARSSSTGA